MREEAKIKIKDLVERFRSNIDAYKKTSYNETQLRREYLDPLFDALGWDVANKAGYAEQYKDVVHEDAIKIGVSSKAPDYSFRVGGQRKFFLEAKKPSVNIKDDISPAYQLRRYAWSAKLPLSILTDFEELAVYDCRIKPNPDDNVATGRVAYYTFEQYVEKFDEIYDILSKESVLKGSFDRYIASSKSKRGTAEVDKEFLKEIESWRDALAKNIALRNEKLDVKELNFAVQQTIDRIIFLRICEDRGIETYGRLLALQNGGGVYKRLMELFYSADKKYNSGLFDFTSDKLSHTLEIDDKVLKELIGGIYYPNSPYEFSVLGADILGNVYEQFLGKVIRLTAGHTAKVDEKPEVKKAGGVYYTPDYIVDYIVKNTVGRLLGGEGDNPSPLAGENASSSSSPLGGKNASSSPSPLEGEGRGEGLNSYNPRLIQLARNLRKNQTDVEKLMWLLIRNNQLGAKFRRQQPIGNYIADFYCPEKKLAIELDGGKHTESKDRSKTEFLNQAGITVLRFWNNEVLENTEGVLQTIWDKIYPPHLNPLPQGERIAFKLTPKQISNLRILDPACGSGSFLIGAYQCLLDYHLNWYREFEPEKHAKGKKPAVYKGHGGEWRLTTTEKKRILLNNIFGVDIDRQAVEVTKLSLLLKVLEGENEETLGKTFALFQERALPNLESNIKCGNSLIGPDFYDTLPLFPSRKGRGKTPSPLAGKNASFSPSPLEGEGWGEGDMERINVFDWNDDEKGFGKIMKEGGFDVVIGNPPYGYMIQDTEQDYFANNYKYQDYQKDLYLLFLEKYKYLIKHNGSLGVIVSNTWLQSVTFQSIRKYLTTHYRWRRILHLPEKVFKAVVDTHVLIFEREDIKQSERGSFFVDIRKGNTISLWHKLPLHEIPKSGEPVNIVASSEAQRVFRRIRSNSHLLKDVCNVFNGIKPFSKGRGVPPQTEKILQEKPYVKEGKMPDKNWSPLLRGSTIHRYINFWNKDYWILYGSCLAEPRDPEIFEAPLKIMVRQTSDKIIATLATRGFYARNNLHIILPQDKNYDLSYILGVINSKLIDFAYTLMNPEKGEALAEVKKYHVEQLPIRPIDLKNKTDKSLHDKMVSLVDNMLELNKKLPSVKTPHERELLERRIKITDNQIDRLVYELYALTEEEIKVVEGGRQHGAK